MLDVEADGPIPGDYSMVCFGAVMVEPQLTKTFYGQLKPISDQWVPEALAVSGFSRQETLAFDSPEEVMMAFKSWVQDHSVGAPIFISDNNGFDWQFINWYFHHFCGMNPFGYTCHGLSSLYKGLVGDLSQRFHHLRITPHTHHPVDDAMGNAESLLALAERYQLDVFNNP